MNITQKKLDLKRPKQNSPPDLKKKRNEKPVYPLYNVLYNDHEGHPSDSWSEFR